MKDMCWRVPRMDMHSFQENSEWAICSNERTLERYLRCSFGDRETVVFQIPYKSYVRDCGIEILAFYVDWVPRNTQGIGKLHYGR